MAVHLHQYVPPGRGVVFLAALLAAGVSVSNAVMESEFLLSESKIMRTDNALAGRARQGQVSRSSRTKSFAISGRANLNQKHPEVPLLPDVQDSTQLSGSDDAIVGDSSEARLSKQAAFTVETRLHWLRWSLVVLMLVMSFGGFAVIRSKKMPQEEAPQEPAADSAPAVDSGDGLQDVKPELKRWHILCILISQQVMNTMLWISFAPISLEISLFYGVSIQWINALSIVCLALFPVGMIWCSYVTTRCGARQALVAAAALNLLSGVLRFSSFPLVGYLGGHAAYAVLLAGQIMCAFAQPICTNLPVRVASDWFSVTERDLATTIGNVGFGLGNIVGMALPSLIVYKEVGTNSVHGMGLLLMLELGACFLAFMWCWAGFVNEPELPPSRTAAKKRQSRLEFQAAGSETHKESLMRVWKDYKSLLQDRHFCILLGAFSVALGGFNCLVTVLEQWLQPAGYTLDDTSKFGNIFVISGVVTAGLSAIVLDRTHAYGVMLKTCFFFTLIAMCNFFLQIRPNNSIVLGISVAIFGAVSLPILPVALESAAEITYPIPEEASTGLLILGGNYLGVFFAYACAALIQRSPTYTGVFTPAAIFSMVIMTMGAITIMFFSGTHKRNTAESSSLSTLSPSSIATSAGTTMKQKMAARRRLLEQSGEGGSAT